jgi:hypothetical protein
VLEYVRANGIAKLRLVVKRFDDLVRPPFDEHATEIEDDVANSHCARNAAQLRAVPSRNGVEFTGPVIVDDFMISSRAFITI